MSKKDYVRLARAFRETRRIMLQDGLTSKKCEKVLDLAVREVSYELKCERNTFDEHKFYSAIFD